MDYDCASGQVCNEVGQCVAPYDGGQRDGGTIVTPDSGPRPFDAGRDAGHIVAHDAGHPRDAGTPRPDSGPPPTPDSGPRGRYLDRCTSDGDCMTGHCVDDVGGTRMCTITCSSHTDCASEHVCGSGLCKPDDTGRICSGASGCVLGLCAGNPATGAGECTRPCNSANDCPSGYACSDAGGVFVCVNIERSCAQCSTGLCLDPSGCSSTCRTPSDCPRTYTGMPYSCSGNQCVPSSYILGSDPIGATCRTVSGGANLCRSGICVTDDASGGEVCTEVCTESGGCGPGYGCVPVDDGGSTLLICLRAGSGALGSACTTDTQCDSGICGAGYCTRLCTSDARCPSDMHCQPGVGGISTCVR